MTWVLGLLNAGLFRGSPSRISRAIMLSMGACLALNIWLLFCSLAYDNDDVRRSGACLGSGCCVYVADP